MPRPQKVISMSPLYVRTYNSYYALTSMALCLLLKSVLTRTKIIMTKGSFLSFLFQSPIRNKSRSSLSISPRKALRLGRTRESGRKSQGTNPTQRSNSESHPNRSSSVREDSPTTRQTQEKNLAAVLIGISLLFIFCQSAKIIPDLYEVIYCRWPSDEPKDCEITAFVTTMVSVSHLLLAINSSSNFIIYAWRGRLWSH